MVEEFDKALFGLAIQYSDVKVVSRTNLAGSLVLGDQLLSYVSDSRILEIYLCKRWRLSEQTPNATYVPDFSQTESVWRLESQRVLGHDEPNSWSSADLAKYWFNRLISSY